MGRTLKTLANPKDKQELLERLSGLRSDTPRAWGKMSAPQMVCHLNDSFRTKLEGIPVVSLSSGFTRTALKWGALWVPLPWPHGVRTPPELDQQLGGTVPGEFETDRQELASLLQRFAEPPGGLNAASHTYFGTISVAEWMRWGYLHSDHHLRQFYC